MRKRSEALAEPVQPTAAVPAAKKEDFFVEPKTEARASVEDARVYQLQGIKYVRCECGLKQSFESAKSKTPGQLECIRCRKALGSLADAEAALGKPGDAPTPIVEQQAEKCATCGTALTVTSAGKFWPCGHSPRAMEAAAKADASVATGNSFFDTPTRDAERAAAIYPDKVVQNNVEPPVRTTRSPKQGQLTFTVGKMVFTPIPYNTFEVGPFSMTVGEDDTPESVMAALKVISDRAHEEALKQYVDRVAKNGRAIDEFVAQRNWKAAR